MMAHLVDFPDLQQKLYGLCPLPQNQPEAPSTGAWLVSFLMGFDADVTPSRGCLALGRRAIRARPQFGPRAPSPGGRHIRSKARVVRRGVPVGGTPSLANRSLRRASGVTRATELADTRHAGGLPSQHRRPAAARRRTVRRSRMFAGATDGAVAAAWAAGLSARA